MQISRVGQWLWHKLGFPPMWHKDLCDYYGVTPSQALELGTRRNGRRPSLPGSPTCQPVSGQTWEELWARYPRDSEEAIFAFWTEIGAWAAFRQVIRNRRRSFAFIAQRLGMMDAFCEWGAGVAPASWWLVQHSPIPLRLTLVDVPSEHLNFGSWRLRRRLEAEWDLCCWSLRVVALEPRIKPLTEMYQGVSVIEVLEHLSDPLETVRHLAEHLELGGWFFEDFTPHADAHAADLPQAQRERQQVYAYVEDRFTLVKGRRWEEPDGGGTRIWKKC